jgi:hypothetical protein
MATHDKGTARLFAAHRAEAEAQLWRHMEALGLHARDGWKITETMREAREGTELVLRPLHLWLEAPDLECVIWVHGEDGSVDSSCGPLHTGRAPSRER